MRHRQGLSMIEVIVVLGIVGLLVSLLAPAVQVARESARRITCASHLHELGVAVHNRHQAKGAIETYQPLRELLPYMEQMPVYAALQQPILPNDLQTPATIRCPSDHSVANRGFSYCVSDGRRGDGVRTSSPATRRRFEDLTDGLSQTSLFSERLFPGGYVYRGQAMRPVALRDPVRFNWYTDRRLAQGTSMERFADYCGDRQNLIDVESPIFNYGVRELPGMEEPYNHLLTPNVPGCVNSSPPSQSGRPVLSMRWATPPSSLHPGGVNVLMCDGAVRFVSASVDRQVWWANGTRSQMDLVVPD
jgi:prepilin-type N-terminal cleavage/methylation domain-containing protein/prepilin-type processing-associated H-X9-DG protein